MRSIWVHASYMQALDTNLLASALELQDHLLGVTEGFSPAHARQTELPVLNEGQSSGSLTLNQRDAVHVANGLTSRSWFFHSPLLYWGCSRDRILGDKNILSTINDRKNQSTSANVTLRHSIVFSGKRFEDRRLLAADALVITLLHLQKSPVGHEWEKRALELPHKVANKWNLYPADGRASSNQLYEFQFRPMSMQDMITLGLAYSLTLLYFLMSLSKLRTVKSKLGLIATIMAQIAFSVTSSFTLCAVFRIDLSRIPRAAYPLVVLAMSLEHIFRLINAVILTAPEDSISNRIGHAFGETGPTALASTVQNVLILAGLSRLVSPGVSEFCVFVAVAIIFDFFYLSTFFLAVLSLDLRRMELGDALTKASMLRNQRRYSDNATRRSRWDQMLQGQIATSTRIAGTVVMIGFVLIAQWHFFGEKLPNFRSNLSPEHIVSTTSSSSLENIHQARSPTSWLRMQDHETAREVIDILKPSSYSYVARVYEPLVFVLRNSDRTPHDKEPTLLPAAYDFIRHESARLSVLFIVVIASLRLLTNYLLWEEDGLSGDQHEPDESPLMSIKSLAKGHRMDVILTTASADGLVVSASVDGTIRVWSVVGRGTSYVISSGKEAATVAFPITALAIDDKSNWLALLSRPKRSAHPQVCFWNLKDKSWGAFVQADSCRPRPLAMFFDHRASHEQPSVLILQPDGSMTEIVAGESRERQVTAVFPDQLTCARVLVRKGTNPCVALPNPGSKRSTDSFIFVNAAHAGISAEKATMLAASKQGELYLASRGQGAWHCSRVALDGQSIHAIEAMVDLNLFVAAAEDRVYIVDAGKGLMLQTMRTEKMVSRRLRCACTCHHLSQEDFVGLTSLTVGYVEAVSGDCVLETMLPGQDFDAIYLQTQGETRINDWCTWELARKVRKRVPEPGVWDIVPDGSAVGIRYQAPASGPHRDNGPKGLRNRRARQTREANPLEGWHVWITSCSAGREEDERQQLVKANEQDEHLLVTQVGPKVKVGQNALAFGFGNMLKLVIAGSQVRLGDDGGPSEPRVQAGSRRRRVGPQARRRAASNVVTGLGGPEGLE